MVVSKLQLRLMEHFVRAMDRHCVATLLTLLLIVPCVRAEGLDSPVPAGDYGAALKWLGDELSAAGKNQPLLIVWLFDQSDRMTDDRHEISGRLAEFYEGLDAQSETLVVGFGDSIHPVMKNPESDVDAVRKAISRIPVDRTGREKMCRAVGMSVQAYGKIARERKLRMVLVVVTDESPSDSGDTQPGDNRLEQSILLCQRAKVPVYVLGQESVFGNAHTRLRWIDPIYRLNHWVRINRGPDSAFPERLMWSGLGPLNDNVLSGFGPYSQERMCQATGGAYFTLMPQPNLKGFQDRRHSMAGYEPDLIPRREYQVATARSRFRAVCREVLQKLNSTTDAKLNLRELHFSAEPAAFSKQAARELEKAAYTWTLLNAAIELLEEVRELRGSEPSKRWQANYDLLQAQCLTYRARLPQYMIALNRHAGQTPKTVDPKHNRWMINADRRPTDPTDRQHARLKTLLGLDESRGAMIDRFASDRAAAIKALDHVITEHPGTPWSVAARSQKLRDIGLKFRSYFHDPRYQEIGKRIKVPVL